ncbi:hypothetical protein CC1G_05996 [Coprinopsis cinerea okayama7|uniref:F-box domain-containing protein n=1 Tax=Coprinopsis cinerea (strain Okayama-7 / 130 / ATCC MYA-4618 / FGSC 9003) TaxID=240176 RepID=A8N4L8_COPC7|nr:hypothetical protein CC1G_05996 [Coprinopsis cinerea okayama7\|eukprot:XP_001829787.2 hypothetical protein CC1G_05996 [Coprinopsis cinerea okayama7\
MSLTGLPLELQVQIFAYLDPEGIVAFRQTCRHFHTLERSFHLSIWQQCVEILCSGSPLFLPTFQFPTLSSKALESMARRASLMEPILEAKQRDPGAEPLAFKTLDLESRENSAAGFNGVFLLPGGRFILALGDKDLQVWDLAPYHERFAMPIIVKSFSIPASLSSRAFTAMGSKDRVFILLEDNFDELEADSGRFEAYGVNANEEFDINTAYELRIAGDEPTFVKLGEVAFVREYAAGSKDLFTFAENMAIMYIDDALLVWDFVNGTYAAWLVHGASPFRPVLEIFSSNGHVYVLRGIEFLVYPIPPLTPLGDRPRALRKSALLASPVPHPQRIRLPELHDFGQYSIFFDDVGTWGLDSARKGPYAVRDYHENWLETIWYNLPDPPASSAATVSVAASEKHTYPPNMFGIGEVVRPYRGRLVTASLWEDLELDDDTRGHVDVKAYASISSRYDGSSTAQSAQETEGKPLITLAPVHSNATVCDFDPFSGILVVAGPRALGCPIRIYDFIRPLLPTTSP